MKRKGISIWEQHLERIVLAAAVLFFIGFTALQFLSEPNSIEVPTKGRVSPGEIDAIVLEQALSLRGRLAPEAAPAVEIPAPVAVLEDFEGRLVASISPAETIVPSERRVVLARELDTQTGVAYHVPSVPAPTSVVREQHFDAVAEAEVAGIAGLEERLGEAPYDLTWITAAALFDLAEVRAEFERSGDGGEAPIPVNWYHDRIDILDVRVEREEYVDGTWTNLVLLETLPGRFSLRDRIADKGIDKSARDTMLAEVMTPPLHEAIVRPPFYGTLNESWTAPDPRIGDEVEDDETASEEVRQMHRIALQIRKKTSKRDQLAARLEELGGKLPGEEREEERKPERPGRAEEPGEPGGAGGSGDRREGPKKKRGAPGSSGFGLGGGGSGGATGQRNEASIKRLQGQIRNYNRQIRQRQKELDALRARVGGDDATATEETAGDEMVVWAHDITVEPGRTYRYRFTVDVHNPFYARKLNLLEEQHDLADGIALRSQPSAWSRPKEAIPDRKVYVTKAYGAEGRNPGSLGLGQATAEVFRFYHGRWWVETFPVQPGDRVGAEQALREGDVASVDFGTDWFVLDVIPDIDAGRDADERGLGARVLLQNVADERLTMLADPVATDRDLDREWLREQVELADAEVDVAQGG